MKWNVKFFRELSTTELYEILRTRTEIFVVEQECIYQDLDGTDYRSLHVFSREEEERVTSYLRIFETGEKTVQMGRVLTLEHGKGLGKELLRRGIQAAKDVLKAEKIILEAQVYAIGFYEKEGFQVCSEEFPEDGIPHVKMQRNLWGQTADRIFEEYAGKYDMEVGKIHLKLVHTREVAAVMDHLTAALDLSTEQRELAHVCAMFHDIGRFEQIVRYRTFLDHLSVDHASLGCEVLKEGNLLAFLPPKQKEQVMTAIENHNKLRISEGIGEDTLLYCKLIRDADKCDIFRVFAREDLVDTMDETLEEVEQEEITDAVYESFMRHECIEKTIRRTGLDKWIGFLAFFFDMNFNESIAYLKERKDYWYQFERAQFKKEETREKIACISRELENYLALRS